MTKPIPWPRRQDGRAKMVSELSADEFRTQYSASLQTCLRAFPPPQRAAMLDRRDAVCALRATALARMVILNAAYAARAAKPASC